MSINIQQDQQFIQNVRDAASLLIQLSNQGAILNTAWNNNFGGEARLGADSFVGIDPLAKADIQNALNVIAGISVWLTTNSTMPFLEKVFNPAFDRG